MRRAITGAWAADPKRHFLLRIAAALAVTLWVGLLGALAGLGLHYLYPAQYRSTARVVVSADRVGDLAIAAKSPATLSGAILVADLYHGERDAVPVGDLARKLPLTVNVTQSNSGQSAILDVSLVYADRDKVQRALDSVVHHMMSEAPPPFRREGAFVLSSRSASAGVRASGIEPGISLLAGFVAGILLHAVYLQIRQPAPRPDNPLSVG